MFEEILNPELIKKVGFGAFYGGQAALIGYMKSADLASGFSVIFTKKFWESFDPLKASQTVLLGVLLGALGVVSTEYPLDPITVNFANDVIVLGVDQLVKLIFRRTPLVSIWNKLKEKMGLVVK